MAYIEFQNNGIQRLAPAPVPSSGPCCGACAISAPGTGGGAIAGLGFENISSPDGGSSDDGGGWLWWLAAAAAAYLAWRMFLSPRQKSIRKVKRNYRVALARLS